MVDDLPDRAARPRLRGWLDRGHGAALVWIIPVVAVVLTGWIGSFSKPLVTATWLAAVGSAVVGLLVHVALEPAPYARKAAIAIAALVGIGLLELLSWQAGKPLFR